MSRFFSFVTYEGQKYFFDDLARIGAERYDSHTCICMVFKLPECKCNKYEIVDGKLVVDNIANCEELLEDVQEWAEYFVASPAFARIAAAHQANLRRKAADYSVRGLELAAIDTEAPLEILQTAAQHWYEFVREAVAKNRKAPEALLALLSRDVSKWVRMAVAGNSNTPIHSLLVLEKDEFCYVRDEAKRSIVRLHSKDSR